MVAEDGSIYATASNGIFRYHNNNWEHFFKVPNDRNFIFHNIEQLKDNSILACADWGFIQFLTNGEIRFFTSSIKKDQLEDDFAQIKWITLPQNSLSELGDLHNASDVLETEGDEVWFALTPQIEVGKLIRFNWNDIADGQLDNFEVFESHKGFDLGEDQKLLHAKDGRIWVINSSSNKGIHIFDNERWESIHINHQFGGDEYMADIVQSENGTIWLSSMAKLYAYNNGEWGLYKAPSYPVPANRIILQKSKSDQLWVTGYKSKVLLLDLSPDQWLTYEDLSFQCETAPDEQWFVERNNRIVFKKGKKWTSYGAEDGLIDAPVRVIHTSKDQIWIAGSHQGKAATAVLRNGRWEKQIYPKLSWGIDYRAILEAKDGSLWFGAAVDAELEDGYLSGVIHLKDPTAKKLEWVHHPSEVNGLDQGSCYGIGQSEDGRIWIGGMKLMFYDGNKWSTLADERLQQYVNYVYSTDNLLLVGSRYYGLFVYDGQTWTNYTTSSGLSDNTIISIDVLPDSTIMVATENSICKFDGNSWTQDIFPEKFNMDFEGGTIYHTAQHIWINHVPRSWKRRVYQNFADQELEFFTTRYRPSVKPPETTPGFFLDRVSADGNCIISWEGTDYFSKTSTQNLMYSYRMDGGNWSDFKKEQQHTFTSLASGDHLLEIRARDLDFNVDPTPTLIQFKVLPPIWKQAWFIILIAAFLIIFGIYEYRVLSKKAKLEVLNNSLSEANVQLKERGRKIETQNYEILQQQKQILEQAKILESKNLDLETRNQEVQEQKDKLEEMVVQIENLSKAKLGFFTNISHELRTPLTLILGPIAQLNKESLPIAQRKQYYEIIQRNASRLLKLINQLLEMRRIEHNALELKLQKINLASYLSEIMSLFNGLALRRNIHLEFIDYSNNIPASIDSDKVEKIIVNLLSNAFKYTEEGGSISIEMNTVDAIEHELDPFYKKYFEIIVEDTGCGINQEQIDFIFDKYFTSKSELTDTANTGIGLSYIKDLIYLMQGEVFVESEAGKGTRFTVYLPCICEKEAAQGSTVEKPSLKIAKQEASLLLDSLQQEHLSSTDSKGNRPKVLLVEDNPDMLHFLENILQEKYRVIKATNGKEGLKKARGQSFDLIVSDVMMPEMDGISFCEKIKKDFATSHIPVILITAKVLEESKLSGYLKGADDYITKPFNPELLLIRIENLLQQRDQLRAVFNKEFMLAPKTEVLESPDEIFLNKLVELINENLSETEFNVETMCKSMHLSHMHFIRKVKQLTGKKPIDLLKSFRMKKARDLLAQNKLTIAEVAYKVGFDLPNSFSRAFKKEFKQTPTEFVNSLKTQEAG